MGGSCRMAIRPLLRLLLLLPPPPPPRRVIWLLVERCPC